MKWHLVAASGIARSCEAQSLAEARFKLRPIPSGYSVLSDATYREPIPTPNGTIRQRLAKPKTRAQLLKAERTARYKRRLRGEHIPKSQKGTPNEKLRHIVLAGNVAGRSDCDIARVVRMSAENVRATRVLLGLPTADERTAMEIRAYWTLGWSDGQIGKRLQMHQPSVGKIRRRMQLPAHFSHNRV